MRVQPDGQPPHGLREKILHLFPELNQQSHCSSWAHGVRLRTFPFGMFSAVVSAKVSYAVTKETIPRVQGMVFSGTVLERICTYILVV